MSFGVQGLTIMSIVINIKKIECRSIVGRYVAHRRSFLLVYHFLLLIELNLSLFISLISLSAVQVESFPALVFMFLSKFMYLNAT